jgi:hypothetical protein
VRTSFERHVGVSTIERNVNAPTTARNVDVPTITQNVDVPTIAQDVDADNCALLTEIVRQIEGKRLVRLTNRFEREVCIRKRGSFERPSTIRMARLPFLERQMKKAAQGPPFSNWKYSLRIKLA